WSRRGRVAAERAAGVADGGRVLRPPPGGRGGTARRGGGRAFGRRLAHRGVVVRDAERRSGHAGPVCRGAGVAGPGEGALRRVRASSRPDVGRALLRLARDTRGRSAGSRGRATARL